MFVSPNTPRSVWVDYESGVAYVQNIKRKSLAILVIPIKGATYNDAPEWMRNYMAVPSGTATQILHDFSIKNTKKSLEIKGDLPSRLFVGREDLCNRIVVLYRNQNPLKPKPH